MHLFLSASNEVSDPSAGTARHDLSELLVVAFVSVLCGATSYAGMAALGYAKEAVFRDFLKVRHGLPSHDTFSAVFRMIDPKALDAAFERVLADIAARIKDADAIDGKALHGTDDSKLMVSACAAPLRLMRATAPEDGGRGGDEAIEALGLIALRGKVVTGDALHCNRHIVAAINDRKGDWCLALKADQEPLLSDARACFGESADEDAGGVTITDLPDPGCVETQEATVVSAGNRREYQDFPGLKAFGRVRSARETADGTKTHTGYFALSWMPKPGVLLDTVHRHWAIEHALHWQLDVSFRQDAARNRKDNGPGNFAVLRRRALDVMRKDPSKSSLSIKLKQAGWDDTFLLDVLNRLAEG